MEYSGRINRADCVLGNMHPGRDLPLAGIESAILSLLDYLPLGFLIVSQTGHVLAANRSATRNLESAGVLSERNGMLSLNSTPAGKKMRELIRVAMDGDAAGLRIARPGGRPLTAVIAPLQNRGDLAGLKKGPWGVILCPEETPTKHQHPAPGGVFFGFHATRTKGRG